jgi:tRNA (guanine-N7-)-methyltransferase
MIDAAHPPLRSFGRTKSRVIKPRQADLLQSLLPQLVLADPASGPINPRALKPDAAEIWLEIGFGGGEHMAAQAAHARDVLILGAEPFLNGVASALRHIDEQALENVRLHVGDARDVVSALPDVCLDRIFILFPDPWPKTRHNKRRLVQEATIQDWARVLKPGGRLRFATDWADYGEWTLERFLKNPAFRWAAERADDWRTAPADHITTRYEVKGLGDIRPIFLDFLRT